MAPKKLIILVEGDSELRFIKTQVIPFLYARSTGFWSIDACKIISNRQLNKKGGNISYEYLNNDIHKFVKNGYNVITTFLDFFRLPSNFPGYTTDGSMIDQIESAMVVDFKSWNSSLSELIPYIQKYEFEALLFSSMDGFEYLLDDDKRLSQIRSIINSFATPEEINGGPSTAPSKRLANIFNYNKVADSSDVLEIIGIDVIRARCPRFSQWLDKLTKVVVE